ncbi:MAG TPA: ABC transporter substrate-binding protein [Paracoccus sp. (in: a-proteobacteria)]|uniref:ABC transporter substrate-binding protein n=1 Tax=Paracoccus sp. TaxID=267 RepID=UPI002C1139B0|nr:ABC transporter substrate-binding protein [Paracoccus sp. (in: a-proteobacteria)]HWL57078.1 ABC transporter substrate-binding protein [Paracoccus sp. (in: a-proteobacteria)]
MVGRWLAVLAAIGIAMPALAEGPERVVSINLCTDQLAMMIAAPGQLVSVSRHALDPSMSAMADEARGLSANSGTAEEIFLLRPDLVLAGSFTNPITLAMLERLGVPVEVFPAEETVEGIRDNMRRMGKALGREAEAGAAITAFDAELARLDDAPATARPRAALYAANGYSSGSQSLAGQIVALAGFDNIADEMGFGAGGHLSLESLLLSHPDLLVEGRRYPGHSRAEEPLDHPALRALTRSVPSVRTNDPDWVCGTPRILRAVSQLRDARLALPEAK